MRDVRTKPSPWHSPPVSKILDNPEPVPFVRIQEVNDLKVTVTPHFKGLDGQRWNQLFPNLPDDFIALNLMARSGFEGFTFSTVLVHYKDKPILAVPLFETRFDVLSLLPGAYRFLFSRFKSLINPRLLGIGFVEAEWSQIGVDSTVSQTVLKKAWQLAYQTYRDIAAQQHTHIMLFYNLNPDRVSEVPGLENTLKTYLSVPSLQSAVLDVTPYRHLDDYLQSFSASARKNLRRKQMKAKTLDIMRTQSPTPETLERIYELYLAMTKKQESNFGIHNRHYFEHICQVQPSAHYVLYYKDARLLAFNLVVVCNEMLVDKYFARDFEDGNPYNLYDVSWLENVRYCIAQGIPQYFAGTSSSALKARLQCRFVPLHIWFQHRQPVIQFIGRYAKRLLQISDSDTNIMPSQEILKLVPDAS